MARPTRPPRDPADPPADPPLVQPTEVPGEALLEAEARSRVGRRRPLGAGGRDARRAQRARAITASVPYISRHQRPYEVLDEEGLELIERNSDFILKEIGIEFRDDPEVLDIWRDAGADVEGERVRFEAGMCRQIIHATAPKEFEQHARNPERSVIIGGNHTVFAPAYGPPFVRDLDGGRRYANIEDFRNFVKLAYASPWLHHSGGTLCEPVDLPVPKRHLEMVKAHLTLTDKAFMGSVTAPERAEDTLAMARLVYGDVFVDSQCVVLALVNANSPLVFDATMLGALKVYARAGQACIVSPFILAGAMSPVMSAGTLAQLYAEAQAGMALTQLLRPGAPVVFGTFASSISMQSGAPTFGTPEPAMVLFGAAQLARRLGVPFRSGGGLCGAKIADAQAGYEAANTLNATLMAGVNFVLHAAGWLEGGLVMGYEKFVMDADQLGMLQTIAQGINLSADGQALSAIQEVGPGGHFLGCAHTQAHFETAFFRSQIADNNSFEQWAAEGEQDASRRANGLWKKMLADYQPPALDESINEALDDYVERRKRELPDSEH